VRVARAAFHKYMKLTHATKNNSRWAAANSTGAIIPPFPDAVAHR